MAVALTTALLLSTVRSSSYLLGCSTELCFPKCNITNRLEIRQTSLEQRSFLVEEFIMFKKSMNETDWNNLLLSKSVCDFLIMMDRRLQKKNMLMPYWDFRIEERMRNPMSSPVFMQSFFEHHNQFLQDDYRDDLISPSLKRETSYFILLTAIKTTKYSQLLAMLRKIGSAFRPNFPEEVCSLCKSTNPFLQCNFEKNRCESKLRPGSICKSVFFGGSKCFHSLCINSLCSVGSRSLAIVPEPREIVKSKRLVSTLAHPEFPLMLSDSNPILSTSKENTNSQTAKKVNAHRETYNVAKTTSGFKKINYQNMIKNIKIKVTSKNMLVPNASPTVSINMPAKSQLSIGHFKTDNLSYFNDRESEKKNTTVMEDRKKPKPIDLKLHDFNATLPFPTVYFTITVIQGEWQRKYKRNKPAESIQVYVKGYKEPAYFQHAIKGNQLDNTHFMIRLPDPKYSNIVRAKVIVKQLGKRCNTLCYSKKNIYQPCKKKTITLSRYVSLGDDIQYYKSEKEAEISLWTSSAYEPFVHFDRFLFSCDITKQ